MKRFFSASAIALLCFALFACSNSKKEGPDDLGEARSALGKRNFLEAEKAFERYLRSNPEGVDRWYVWQNLVELSLNVRGDRKGAIELLEAMLVEYAATPDKERLVRMRLAEQYRLSRKYDRAVELWGLTAGDKGASSLEKAESYRNLAEVYLRRLEFELAKEALNMCIALAVPDPVRGQCLYDLAQTHMGTDESDEAVARLRAVLELKDIPAPLRGLTVFMLADALDQQGKSAEALALFESIRASYPNPQVVAKRIDALRKPKKKTIPPAVVPLPAAGEEMRERQPRRGEDIRPSSRRPVPAGSRIRHAPSPPGAEIKLSGPKPSAPSQASPAASPPPAAPQPSAPPAPAPAPGGTP